MRSTSLRGDGFVGAGEGEAVVRHWLPVVAGSFWVLVAISSVAWTQSAGGCSTLAAGSAPLDAARLNDRLLSRPQLTWCMRQARTITTFLDRAERRKLDLNRVRILLALKRTAEKTTADGGSSERNFRSVLRASRLDEATLTTAGEVFDTMETYDIACAGRPYSWQAEAAVLRELRLSQNPMRTMRYPATGPVPEANDHLRSGLWEVSEADKAAADRYHRYLVQEITAHMQVGDQRSMRGQVRVRLRLAPTGGLISRSVVVSSGAPAFDAAVLAAIDRGQPYCPPPYTVAYSPNDILATFSLVGTKQD